MSKSQRFNVGVSRYRDKPNSHLHSSLLTQRCQHPARAAPSMVEISGVVQHLQRRELRELAGFDVVSALKDKRIKLALKHWSEKQGLIRSMPGMGQEYVWEIVR